MNGKDGWLDVGSELDLRRTGRMCVPAGQRTVVVFRLAEDRIYALDSRCYHMGGPLETGAIEDLGAVPVVRCPWHKYRISLETGETFGAGGQVVKRSDEERAKWLRQRTHAVQVLNGRVLVKLSLPTDPESKDLDSDAYQPTDPEVRRRMNL